jgi:hypothetical protein
MCMRIISPSPSPSLQRAEWRTSQKNRRLVLSRMSFSCTARVLKQLQSWPTCFANRGDGTFQLLAQLPSSPKTELFFLVLSLPSMVGTPPTPPCRPLSNANQMSHSLWAAAQMEKLVGNHDDFAKVLKAPSPMCIAPCRTKADASASTFMVVTLNVAARKPPTLQSANPLGPSRD